MERESSTALDIFLNQLDVFKQNGYLHAMCECLSSVPSVEFPSQVLACREAENWLANNFRRIRRIVNLSDTDHVVRWMVENRDRPNLTSTQIRESATLFDTLVVAYRALMYSEAIREPVDFHINAAMSDTSVDRMKLVREHLKNIFGKGIFKGVNGSNLLSDIMKYLEDISEYRYFYLYLQILQEALENELGNERTLSDPAFGGVRKWYKINRAFLSALEGSPLPSTSVTLATLGILVRERSRLHAIAQLWERSDRKHQGVIIPENLERYFIAFSEKVTLVKTLRDIHGSKNILRRLQEAREFYQNMAFNLCLKVFLCRKELIEMTFILSNGSHVQCKTLCRFDKSDQVCSIFPIYTNDPHFLILIEPHARVQYTRSGELVKERTGWPMLFYPTIFEDFVSKERCLIDKIYVSSNIQLAPVFSR